MRSNRRLLEELRAVVLIRFLILWEHSGQARIFYSVLFVEIFEEQVSCNSLAHLSLLSARLC